MKFCDLRPAFVLAFSGLVAGLGYLTLSSPDAGGEDAPSSEHAPLAKRAAFAAKAVHGASCEFAPGQRMAYAVESETTIELDLGVLTEGVELGGQAQLRASEAKAHASRRVWQLELEVIARADDGSSVLAARVEDRTPAAQAGRSASPHLSDTFLIRVDPRCGVREFGWRSDGDLDAAREQQVLVAGLGFWAPSDGSRAHSYGGTGFDATGRYAAGYHYDGSGQVRGEIRSYALATGVAHGLAVELDVLASNIEVELGAGTWFESLVNERDLELSQGGRVFGAHYRSTRATRAALGEFRPRVDLDDGGWTWGVLAGERGEIDDRIDPALRELSLDDALARYRTLLAEGDVGQYTTLLRDWLRANPEAAAQLRERLEAGEFDDEQRARSGVFFALGSADTPQSREVLLGLVAEGRPGYRVAAAHALALTSEPSTQMVELLADASGQAQLHAVERGSMALALGSLARTSEAHAPEVAAAAREQIGAWLAAPADEQQLGASLLAAGNAGHDSLVPAIAGHLDHDSPAVRRDATRALRNMSPEQSLPHLESRLADEDAVVRTTALEVAASVARQGDQAPPPGIVDAAAGLLEQTAADAELAAAIDLLGVAAQHGDAHADELLRAQLHAQLRAPDRDLERLAALGSSSVGRWEAD